MHVLKMTMITYQRKSDKDQLVVHSDMASAAVSNGLCVYASCHSKPFCFAAELCVTVHMSISI